MTNKLLLGLVHSLIFVTLSFQESALAGDPASQRVSESIFNYELGSANLLEPSATVINFDNLPAGTIVNAQYPQARFSSNSLLYAYNYPNYSGQIYNYLDTATGFNYVQLDFTEPVKDVSRILAIDNLSGVIFTVDIYERGAFARSVPAYGSFSSYYTLNLSQSGTKITKIVIRSINDQFGLVYDDFVFTPNPSSSPLGNFDSVSVEQSAAVGWSLDPDNQSASNNVECFISGNSIGIVPANLPSPDVPHPGNHRFSLPIPVSYRDGSQHAMNCYGLDLLGGDPRTLLPGSPKTFTLQPVVVSTTFVELPGSPLSLNPNAGGGLRMFPERAAPAGPVNNMVRVKARISTPTAGIPVYFYAFDLDDPSTDSPPIDANGSGGRDNRSDAQIGDLCPDIVAGCFDSVASAYRMLTDVNGEAVISFRLTQAHPGDNYAISATTLPSETSQIGAEGTALKNQITGRTLQVNIDRTQMLTAWRKLHIEVDSMGVVQNNLSPAVPLKGKEVSFNSLTSIRLRNILDPGRFQNGRLFLQYSGQNLVVNDNNSWSVSVLSFIDGLAVPPFSFHTLYDDDDFNGDNAVNGFDADNGEDVDALSDTFDLIQENDDVNCNDKKCNVFAPAYIQPVRIPFNQYNSSDIAFVQNVNDDISSVEVQIDKGRFLESGENDDFWIAYLLISYQHDVTEDCDPDYEQCTTGTSVGLLPVDDVTSESEVPVGAVGSLIYIEAARDGISLVNNVRITAVPHEIGHQFGIRGDDLEPGAVFGIMGYSGGIGFVDRHINILRWRRKSPGSP